jgi:FAD/FMN-containing dehydrogenases
MLKTSSIEENLRAAVGSQNLRAATVGDSVCGVRSQFVAEPENEEQLAALLSCANEAGVAVVPRGARHKIGLG